MRPMLSLTALILLAGCASMSGSADAQRTELARLEADCTARQGILVSVPGGPTSANEAANYTCNIQRDASRIQR